MVWNMLYKLHFDQNCSLHAVWLGFFNVFYQKEWKKIKATYILHYITLRNNSKVLHICWSTKNSNVSNNKWEFSVSNISCSTIDWMAKSRHTHTHTHCLETLNVRAIRFDKCFLTFSIHFHFYFQEPITLFISIKSNSLLLFFFFVFIFLDVSFY